MKYLTTILKRFLPKEIPKPMGRWSTDYCDKKTNFKVDLSNEDHCGPCGQYVLIKQEMENKDNTINHKHKTE